MHSECSVTNNLFFIHFRCHHVRYVFTESPSTFNRSNEMKTFSILFGFFSLHHFILFNIIQYPIVVPCTAPEYGLHLSFYYRKFATPFISILWYLDLNLYLCLAIERISICSLFEQMNWKIGNFQCDGWWQNADCLPGTRCWLDGFILLLSLYCS